MRRIITAVVFVALVAWAVGKAIALGLDSSHKKRHDALMPAQTAASQ